ncbi:MAG TPA: site-2 protease family protein [bacterium]|nr:site-2 protease family protein [bacterium]
MNNYYQNTTWTWTPVEKQAGGGPGPAEQPVRAQESSSLRVPILLFIITVFSTIWAGCIHQGVNVFREPWLFYKGLPFSLTLLLILGIHELGHYILCRVHGIPSTVPYFIPMPNFLGTMGAFIRIKQTITRRRVLLDVGMAGPLAGFVIALPATVIGYMLSATPVPEISAGGGLILGQSLLTWVLELLIFPTLPEGYTFMLHPVAFAGYIGLFVTAMNLLPLGQLDGSHIVSAMFGKTQWRIAKIGVGFLFFFGIFWSGWWFWALLLLVFGIYHPEIRSDARPLDKTRRILAWITIVIFMITFVPVPFSFGSFAP